jgi:hypothetical protein
MMGHSLCAFAEIELMYSLCVQALLYLPTPTHPNAPRLCLHLASSCVEVYLCRIHRVKCSLGLQSMLFVLRPMGAGAEYPPINAYLLSGKEPDVDLVCCLLPLSPPRHRHNTEWI